MYKNVRHTLVPDVSHNQDLPLAETEQTVL